MRTHLRLSCNACGVVIPDYRMTVPAPGVPNQMRKRHREQSPDCSQVDDPPLHLTLVTSIEAAEKLVTLPADPTAPMVGIMMLLIGPPAGAVRGQVAALNKRAIGQASHDHGDRKSDRGFRRGAKRRASASPASRICAASQSRELLRQILPSLGDNLIVTIPPC